MAFTTAFYAQIRDSHVYEQLFFNLLLPKLNEVYPIEYFATPKELPIRRLKELIHPLRRIDIYSKVKNGHLLKDSPVYGVVAPDCLLVTINDKYEKLFNFEGFALEYLKLVPDFYGIGYSMPSAHLPMLFGTCVPYFSDSFRHDPYYENHDKMMAWEMSYKSDDFLLNDSIRGVFDINWVNASKIDGLLSRLSGEEFHSIELSGKMSVVKIKLLERYGTPL